MGKKNKTPREDKFTRVTLFWDPCEYPDIEELYHKCKRGEFNQLILDTIVPKAKEHSLAGVVNALNKLTTETRRLYNRIIAGEIDVKDIQQEIEQIEGEEQRELLEDMIETGI